MNWMLANSIIELELRLIEMTAAGATNLREKNSQERKDKRMKWD